MPNSTVTEAAADAPGTHPSVDSNSSTEQLEPSPGYEDTPSPPPTSLRPSLSWKSFRSSLSISEKTSAHLGWAIAFLSVLFTIVTLSPAFKSQDMSAKALKLAEWTALKDYIEECREELAAGIQSQACLKAMDVKLPPPPYVKPGILDKIRRSLVHVEVKYSETSRAPQVVHREVHVPGVIQGVVGLGVLLTACVFLFLSFEVNRSRVRRRAREQQAINNEEEKVAYRIPPVHEPEMATVNTIRHPPALTETSLRRRVVRSHPIYRHANLEEAFHHEDMAEIRLRLKNGEDVNQHWPYLIYKLAISPPTIDTPKRLEIARLCLDFGADVNALKGWNGQSALMIAIHFGNVDVAKLLILNGAMVCYSPPDSNLTALHRCVRLAVTGSGTDALEIMELLFDHGANPDQADRTGETALHKLFIDAWLKRDNEACLQKLIPIARCLIKRGAQIPKTIKAKYAMGNPLWDIVHSTLSNTELPEHVGHDPRLQKNTRLSITELLVTAGAKSYAEGHPLLGLTRQQASHVV